MFGKENGDMSSKLFRNQMFGGYKKEDVDEYIQKLEAEVARLEAGEKSGSDVQPSSKPEQPADMEDFIVLDAEGELPVQGSEQEQQGKPICVADTELEQLKAELEEERAKYDQTSRMLQRMIFEKQELADEVEELRTEQQSYVKDRDAIKEVLINTKINAEIVMAQARREARLLLEDARKRIDEEKQEKMAQLMGQLSEKYTGLQVSRCVLEEQVKTIEGMEQQLADIRRKMQSDIDGTTV